MIEASLGERARFRKARAGILSPAHTIGRYVLAQMVQPFSATLLVIMPALLLERLLRLFDLIANRGVAGGTVVRLLVDLVPHYLGLALPAALFASVYVVVARLSATSELEAMQSVGVSLRWISLPFFGIGLIAMLAGFGLYDYAQPYARYAYRAAFQAAIDGGWDATVPAGEMTRISPNLVVTADKSNRVTGALRGVVVYHRTKQGERIVTARTGRVVASPDGGEVLLTLDHAIRLDTEQTPKPGHENEAGWLASDSESQVRPFVMTLKAFRSRGTDEREMTQAELGAARKKHDPALPQRRIDGEVNGRLVRSLSLALLPLLAVPFGLAAKRARRDYGLVIGIVILVLYYHAIQLAQSVGTAGFLDPRPLLWGAFALFAAGCLAAFHQAEQHSAEGPLDWLFDTLDRLVSRGLQLWRRVRTLH
jgi:lipopolysaccharide export system permease protein